MKAVITNLMSVIDAPMLNIEHRGEVLTFNVVAFLRKSFTKHDVFAEINSYWEYLSTAEQDELFELFRDVRDAFESTFDKEPIASRLIPAVTALVNFYDLEKLERWVMYDSNIIISSSRFEAEYIVDIDKRGNREKTYIRSDYRALVTMALVLRSMLPVWGEYIARTRHDTGTVFKEYYAFHLLNNTNLINCTAMNKLREYLAEVAGPDASNINTIIGGISSEDFPVWILGLVCVRRLCIGDISGADPDANLVTSAYKYVMQRISNSENNQSTAITDKDKTGSGVDSEDKLSALEKFKRVQTISIGDIAEINHAVSDYKALAYRLAPNMTDELFNACMTSASILNGKRLLDPQMTIARWVLSAVISPKGLMYLPKPTVVNCLGICQAVLIARGHHYMALMSTAYANSNDDEISLSGVDTRARLSKELIDDINYYYPHHKRTGSKVTVVKTINTAVQAIDVLVADLSSVAWVMSANDAHISMYFTQNKTRHIPITHDIKVDVAKLVVDLAKLKEVMYNQRSV